MSVQKPYTHQSDRRAALDTELDDHLGYEKC